MPKIEMLKDEDLTINFGLVNNLNVAGLYTDDETFSNKEGLVIIYKTLLHNIKKGKVYLIRIDIERKGKEKDTILKIILASNIYDLSIYYFSLKKDLSQRDDIDNFILNIKRISGFNLEYVKLESEEKLKERQEL